MKINIEDSPPYKEDKNDMQVGSVYRTAVGHIHIIVGLTITRFDSERALALVFKDGELTNCVCYGAGYYKMRTPVGFCENALTDLTIEWF